MDCVCNVCTIQLVASRAESRHYVLEYGSGIHPFLPPTAPTMPVSIHVYGITTHAHTLFFSSSSSSSSFPLSCSIRLLQQAQS
ncbi:hypothetical protein VTH06DRAFT_6982 [Thermothelomyces fergusii]